MNALKLFAPVTLGTMKLNHRVVMAPLTRGILSVKSNEYLTPKSDGISRIHHGIFAAHRWHDDRRDRALING